MKAYNQNRHLRKVLSKLARNDSKTKEVILTGFNVGDEGSLLATLTMSLVGNTHVKILCLNNCRITSKGAHLLAYALGKNENLVHLWLNDNNIGSSGAEAIATALATNRTLLTLGLSNNSIGNHGGRALKEAIMKSYSIVDVFLEGNRMSDKIEDQVNKALYGTDDDGEGINGNQFTCNCTDSDSDAGTHTGSVVSKSFVTRTLGAIKEVDYESDDDSEDDCSTSSSMCNDEPMDLDFTCFYQKRKESKLSKLKKFVKRKRIGPIVQ